ncbi:MAG: diguanylate cyclase [Janthinobacterium lividum]
MISDEMTACEVLHRSRRTIVSRVRDAPSGTTVIRKELLGPDALARQRHEVCMLGHLAGLPGVSQLLSVGPGAVLMFRDDGRKPLTVSTAMAPSALVDLARHVARSLAGVHGRGVLHLDITPANILHGGADLAPELTDFSLAVLAAEEVRQSNHAGHLAGTLAYIAPELTGRTAQAIDQRTDLYELGATLYELATSVPPFGRSDTLALIHDHLATVPVPPSQRAAELPPLLSDIIMRLLEKEPSRRYQSAEGLADDLDRLYGLLTGGQPATFPLGATDFPAYIAPPSRPTGRDREIDELRLAFADSMAGRCPGVLIQGAAGVGKTALIEQLRAPVLAYGGLFVGGSYDPHQGEGASSALMQVMRGIVALLLAEPKAELSALQAKLQACLGVQAKVLASVVPETAALLGCSGLPGATLEGTVGKAGLIFLHAIASPSRPLVIVLDDLQWAPPASLKLISGLLAGDGHPGLMIVAASRDVDAAHPLAGALSQWEAAGMAPRRLRLENLSSDRLCELLGEMLRLSPDAARPLADAVGARTGGNPFDAVELLNGLRRDGTLRRCAGEWHWDSADIHRHVGHGDVTNLLQGRIKALPAATQNMLANMACLGSEPALDLLAAASNSTVADVERLLTPGLDAGLLVPAPEANARAELRFSNHRVLELAYHGMDPCARQARHLALARRLAPLPAHAAEAAGQYLPAATLISASNEAKRAAELFESAAEVSIRNVRQDIAERYHDAAIGLLETLPAADLEALVRLRTARLTALYCLGRYEDVDLLFASIGCPAGDPLPLAEASCIQVLSLCNRGRHREAVSTGLAMLAHLGIHHPAEALAEAVEQGLAELREWIAGETAATNAQQTETNDPLVRAAARLINRMLPTAQLLDPLTGAWLAVESQRLWARHGVCPELIANLARSAASPIVLAGDYRTAYRMGQHAVALGASFGCEPETSLARQNFATFALHWSERLENAIVQCAAAHSGLNRAGEVQAVFINHLTALAAQFDCAETLEGFSIELAAAQDFAVRTGNTQGFESLHTHRLLLQVLTGGTGTAAMLDAVPDQKAAVRPLSLFGSHSSRALAALLFDDPAQLACASAALMPLLSHVGGAYRCMAARLARAVSLAQDARVTRHGQGSTLPAEFHALRDWFAERAADAPANYKHLLHFIDAEAAWTTGAAPGAIRAFDLALQCCSAQTRPWHHALIAERSGLFHLASGLDYAGRALLHDARERYAAWGATAVVSRMTAAHGFLDVRGDGHVAGGESQSVSIESGAIDLLAVLRASQALSSQTSIGGLHGCAIETLAAMTGATSVRLVIWDDDRLAWCLLPVGDGTAEPIESATTCSAVPLSIFRTVERTRAPLVVDDAKLDDRFARDVYFSGMDRCSLLALPVLSQGALRAVLILENLLSRGIFSHSRLNVVTLVANQLAVSLDNARVYESLERRVAERTEALAVANQRLEQLSTSDGLTGLANRRHFDVVLHREWLRAFRAKASLGLVLIDIDHFKAYNDHYGHVGGDRCLRAVALALQGSVRQDIDLAARYGGEEFALIMPGADLTLATTLATRVHAAVLSMLEPHAGSSFASVTVSVGVAATVPVNDSGHERLIETADAALYRAKRQGRNRVYG